MFSCLHIPWYSLDLPEVYFLLAVSWFQPSGRWARYLIPPHFHQAINAIGIGLAFPMPMKIHITEIPDKNYGWIV